MQLLSLFCGAGGLDLGFRQSGYNLKLAIDWSEAAIKTHKHNFPESTALKQDLLQLGVPGMLELCSQYFTESEAMGIIGGPPCQGFSRGNPNSFADDPRNKLAILYVEFITEVQKKFNVDFVVFENVLGIKDKKHIHTYNKITSQLDLIGYDVYENELNAVNFGVAQERRRVIIVAIKKGLSKKKLTLIPSNPEGRSKTVRDVISGLPEPIFFQRKMVASDIGFHPNHWTMYPKSEKFRNPELLLNKKRSFRTINWDKPSPTIAYGNREIYVHPDKKRRLSIFESMLLQGFPKEFVLKGTLSQQVTQVSNAVPPPMAFGIAQAVKSIIKEAL
ncbi:MULTISPECIES: DNA cytosine methyltransferase [Klebsiella pneumoniae complex]|uniref:DNA cytosine methyltransferase n=1 Tax=Klebsiella pneumoniae complex TaxID=3390273 RepID=UPI000D74F81C|nr:MULTISPECIES: DNA cytosine methyltransferase [Klebsiella]HDU4799930.1 DNA cytosine methyltransferase [Klebsiella pneumoniae subsp. pneumoniae]EIX9424924.1 DNA cytosine methyltransferase [Klebsiella pneumoniae]EKW1755824.1 DNA cytosine methyltransferase [Klebsiella pneumoniae]ELB4288087.1 DNA cytosine methyltransferase [Klebsiella pneumoniae]MBK5828812.1 DNA cytosine methyltransferase [Klebsiella pneumoniae]